MIESTSSCTHASASKPNFFTDHGTIAVRNDAPGIDLFFFSHAEKRPAMPAAFGIPPTPGGRSSTRLHSVSANWPSRKNASRGSVATQFGLPRPAFRYEVEDSCADFVATFARKSLISNGPSFSYFARSRPRAELVSRGFLWVRSLLRFGVRGLGLIVVAIGGLRGARQERRRMRTIPQIVSRVLPTA